MNVSFAVSKSDWSLHRKGPADQKRHKEKIREAIKNNLADIVSHEDIILADDEKVVKVPIRSLEEYKFRFDPRGKSYAGQGSGDSHVGDVIGRVPREGQGPRGQAGTEPGIDYYEMEITMEELAELIFEDMGLPNLEDKKKKEIDTGGIRFSDVRKSGIWGNLDKRRTIKEGIKRQALSTGKPQFKDVKTEDLRFKTWQPEKKYESNAVILAMMDTSGSMGDFEKYIARSFYFWLVRFLRHKYSNVKIVFIAHHTEAKEVSEDDFFHRGESGGTKVSSAYQLALDTIKERFPPDEWNIYPFHFSDGENLPWDNETCVQLIEKLLSTCNLFGYGEIHRGGGEEKGSLITAFKSVHSDKFVREVITDKKDVYPTLKKFLSSSETEVARG
ncbi:MAG: sporulation protein YhbH [Chloroflexi bacterium]|nr:sporulation protein YhbH [Chloroflexota bacterium]